MPRAKNGSSRIICLRNAGNNPLRRIIRKGQSRKRSKNSRESVASNSSPISLGRSSVDMNWMGQVDLSTARNRLKLPPAMFAR